jgi:hypothetical protein
VGDVSRFIALTRFASHWWDIFSRPAHGSSHHRSTHRICGWFVRQPPWRLSHKGARSAGSASGGTNRGELRAGRRAVPLIRGFAGAIHGGVPRPIDGPDVGVVCATASMDRSSQSAATACARMREGQASDRSSPGGGTLSAAGVSSVRCGLFGCARSLAFDAERGEVRLDRSKRASLTVPGIATERERTVARRSSGYRNRQMAASEGCLGVRSCTPGGVCGWAAPSRPAGRRPRRVTPDQPGNGSGVRSPGT